MEVRMNRDEKLLADLKKAVLDNLNNDQFSVEKLARLVRMSRSHLHRKLKLLTGQSISQFIREIRLSQALSMLRRNEGTSSEIAYRVGFNSSTYFHKCFTERYGYPPGDVRLRMQDLDTDNTLKEDLEFAFPKSPPDKESSQLTAIAEEKSKKKHLFQYRYLLILLLFLFIGTYWLYQSDRTTQSHHLPEKSIAVLPFQNVSSDERNQHFADGLADDLLSRLAMIHDFKVISWTSSKTYRDQSGKRIPEIASELGVSYILEGSVQRQDHKIRVSVKLIDAVRDESLWVQSFYRNLGDIFNVQNEIAVQVAASVQGILTRQESSRLVRKTTTSVRAFEYYQLGRYYWGKRKFKDYWTALDYFEKALEEDPNYALAYAGMADTYFLLIWNYQEPDSTLKYRNLAEDYAHQALQIDPELAEAHTVLATVYFFIDWDWERAESTFIKALRLNPNYSTLHHRYAEHLSQTGRHLKARKHMDKAIELDPLSYVIRRNSAYLYLCQGELDLAMQEALLCEELGENQLRPEIYKLRINYLRNDGPAVLKSLQKVYKQKSKPVPDNLLDSIYLANGIDGLFQWHIDQISSVSAKAEYYSIMGDNDLALYYLEQAYQSGNRMADVSYIYSSNNLHSHPRFIALLQQMGLPWSPENPDRSTIRQVDH